MLIGFNLTPIPKLGVIAIFASCGIILRFILMRFSGFLIYTKLINIFRDFYKFNRLLTGTLTDRTNIKNCNVWYLVVAIYNENKYISYDFTNIKKVICEKNIFSGKVRQFFLKIYDLAFH